MNTLVIYDSEFGNTKKVAEELGKAINAKQIIHVNEADASDFDEMDLIIVGSPTQAFNPLPAVSKWLKSLPQDALKGKKVAAFDTRANLEKIDSKMLKTMVHFFGYAAKPISKKLVSKGGELIAEPEGFLVEDKEGPLTEGELERAKKWAEGLIG